MPEALHGTSPTPDGYRRLAREAFRTLLRHDIRLWFPRAVDQRHGGFLSNFSATWEPLPAPTKTLVFQSRMTWFSAQLSGSLPRHAAQTFRSQARQGVRFLQRAFLDEALGGLFWSVDATGERAPGHSGNKHAYGLAFAIFACAAVAHHLKDKEALGLAQETFRWLDRHGHDSENDGYHEAFSRDGIPIVAGPADQIGTPANHKSSNAHLHLLEAFTELYKVWPDAVLRERLEELLGIVQARMVAPAGFLHQVFTARFQPVPGPVSYGHDVETAHLLIGATRALGRAEDAALWQTVRALVDHALDFGYDRGLGGFYQQGPPDKTATDQRKVWWAQAEALSALLLLHEHTRDGDLRYWQSFIQTWGFIRHHQIDSEYGGWFGIIRPDGTPHSGPKGYEWKDPYHSGRALLNIRKNLRRLAKKEATP
jgi:mannobiose 2-epimerase